MTDKERKSQGIYKTSTGKYYQAYKIDDVTYMSPMFNTPEKVKEWFKVNRIRPIRKPIVTIWG